MYGFQGTEVPPGLWGGYATHHYLGPDSMLLPVPAELDPVLATVFNPLGAGIQWGVTVPGTTAGDRVAVLGPGIRGLSVVRGRQGRRRRVRDGHRGRASATTRASRPPSASAPTWWST